MEDQAVPATEAQFIAGKAILHATISIKRAATGLTETYQITGTPTKDEACQQPTPQPSETQ